MLCLRTLTTLSKYSLKKALTTPSKSSLCARGDSAKRPCQLTKSPKKKATEDRMSFCSKRQKKCGISKDFSRMHKHLKREGKIVRIRPLHHGALEGGLNVAGEEEEAATPVDLEAAPLQLEETERKRIYFKMSPVLSILKHIPTSSPPPAWS